MSVTKATFLCDEKLLNEFRKLVAQKYGRLYGVLQKEFSEALKQRIEVLKKELMTEGKSINEDLKLR